NGAVWVVDTANARVVRYSPPFTSGMAADLVIGQPGFYETNTAMGPRGLAGPNAIYVDPPSGEIFVGDNSNYRVLGFPLGSAIGQPQGGGVPPGFAGSFLLPGGATFSGGFGRDQANRVVVDTFTTSQILSYVVATTSATTVGNASGGLWLIAKYDASGVLLASATVAGTGGQPANAWDGALDGAGNLYVVGQTGGGNSRIVKYSPSLGVLATQSIPGDAY